MTVRSAAAVAAGLGLVVSLAGCASVQIEGPVGDPVTLAKPAVPTSKAYHAKSWYMFWGLVPLTDTSTSQMIREAKMDVVRIKVFMGLDDMFMTVLGIVPVIPVSRSILIEGN